MRRLAFRLAPALPSRPLTLIDITFSARLNRLRGAVPVENAPQCDKAARDFQHRDLAGDFGERDGIVGHRYANASSPRPMRYVFVPINTSA